MAKAETTTKRDDGPNRGDLELAIHALHGVFWALNVLSDTGLDTLRSDQERTHAIANLIVAGEMITEDLERRF